MNRKISMRDIERISKESARILYGADVADQSCSPNTEDYDSVPIPQIRMANSEFTGPSVIDIDQSNLQLANALKIIEAQTNNTTPFLFRSEAAGLANIKGAATLQSAEKEALMAKVIKRHEIAKAKTNIILWEITKRGYAMIKRERPKWKSKGDYRHKFCVYRIAYSFGQQGLRPTFEYRRPNGKLVDLLLSKDNESIYVEICASYPVEKELVNIEKNLDGPPTPTAMYFCVTDRKMKNSLKQVLQDFSSGFSLPCPVEVILAGDIIGPLEEIR